MNGRRGQLGASTNLSMGRKQVLDRKSCKLEGHRWAVKSEPVATRFVCPICGEDNARADHSPA